MRIRTVVVLIILTAVAPAAHAQERLPLAEAVARTLRGNPALKAVREGQRVAAAGVDQARAGWLPRVDYVEAWQRSNQPVFVFGSLLAQSRFGAANFALDALNNPDAVTNTRGALSVQQTLFDPAQRARVRAAAAGRDLASLSATAVERELALGTARAYGQVLVAAASRRAAQAAVDAAEQDRARAEHRREAGLATDADVLAFQVHAAGMQARRAQAAGDESVARAALNDLIGAPLDSTFTLDDVAPPTAPPAAAVADLEREALEKREQLRQAAVQEQAAAANQAIARAAFLPQAGFQGGYEFDGRDWSGRQTWWAAGVEVRWNLFNGFGDRARLAGATAAVAQARANRERVENAIRLEVRSAAAQLDAARAREAAGRTAVTQAREAQRIIRERYEAGFTGVTDVLRAANALLEAELQEQSARVDAFVAERTLEWAVGR